MDTSQKPYPEFLKKKTLRCGVVYYWKLSDPSEPSVFQQTAKAGHDFLCSACTFKAPCTSSKRIEAHSLKHIRVIRTGCPQCGSDDEKVLAHKCYQLVCHTCSQSVASIPDFLEHFAQHHMSLKPAAVTDKAVMYSCKACGENLENDLALFSHAHEHCNPTRS